eukprot:jgi/Mesen1/10584/ME000085S09912
MHATHRSLPLPLSSSIVSPDSDQQLLTREDVPLPGDLHTGKVNDCESPDVEVNPQGREGRNGFGDGVEKLEAGPIDPHPHKMPDHTSKSRHLRRRTFSFLLCFIIGLAGGFVRFDRGSFNEEEETNYSYLDLLNPDRTAGKGSSSLYLDPSMYKYSSLRDPSPTVTNLPLLIVVTPTYVRPFQAMYLNRMINTLRLVKAPVLWLVVEILFQASETATILQKSGLMYRHIVAKVNMTDIKDRGVHQRNAALTHIESHRLDGIVYFADDDNIYTQELFEEIRTVRRFGTWPVGMLQQGKSRATIEGPVCKGDRVIGWHTNEKSQRIRRFHVDMCGFAFNSTILWDPHRWRRPTDVPIRQLDSVKEGFQETTFIEQLVADESHMEALASSCSKVLVWHIHLEASRHSPFPRFSSFPKLPPITPLKVTS